MAKKTKNQKNTTKSTTKHTTKHTSQETRYIEKAFEDSLKGIRKLHSKEKNTAPEGDRFSQWAQYDMDDRRYARRKRAAETYLELAREYAVKNCAETLFSSEMEKNEPDRYGFATRWGRLNSLPQIGYDGLNQDTYLTVAAAIWILDRIRDYNLIPFLDENGKIERNEYGYPKTRKAKLMEILPMVDEAEDVDMPHLWDCTHSEEIIREVVAVIEQRNDDCIGRKHKEDRLYRPFLDSFITEGTHKQDVPSRRRFETLLSLIPEEDMLDMAEQYEHLMWEWMGMYLASVNEFLQKEDVIYQKVQKKHKELDALYGEAEKRLKALRSGKSKNQNGSTGMLAKGPVANPLLMNPQQGFPVNPMMGGVGSIMGVGSPMMGGGSMMNTATLMGSGTPMDDIAFRIPELEKDCDRLEKQFIDLRNSELETLFNLEKLFSEPEGAVITRMNLALKDDEAAVRAMDAFSGIAIQDPYSVCFGLLYLIDSGSDLPWLYFPALSVAKLAAVHLPWYSGSYDEEEDGLGELPGDSEDEFMDDALDERDDADGDAADRDATLDEETLSDAEYIRMRERIQWEKNHREISFPKSLRVPEIPDWYRLNLTNKEEEDYFGDRVSLSRIVYDMTGAIMPRNLKRYEKMLPALSNFGIRGKKALPYEYIMLLLGEAQRQTQDWRELNFDEGAFNTRETRGGVEEGGLVGDDEGPEVGFSFASHHFLVTPSLLRKSASPMLCFTSDENTFIPTRRLIPM